MREENWLTGVHQAPNIQCNSAIYEIENQACDPEKRIEEFFESKIQWKNKVVLDVGCGTGYHLPYFARQALHVFGIEPADELRRKAMQRVIDCEYHNISLLKGSAENIFLKDNFIDLAYARFAYFWGDGCQKGIEEVFRVLKKDGLFFLIDNNLRKGDFAKWLKMSWNVNESSQDVIDKFWEQQGFSLKEIESSWTFENREDLEAVVKIEFSDEIAQKIIENHQGNIVTYTFNVYWKVK